LLGLLQRRGSLARLPFGSTLPGCLLPLELGIGTPWQVEQLV
jgi:hypothetical protein